MARVAVDVVIKPEILDPQGKAIEAALARSGHTGVTAVRAGKHFELVVDDSVTDEQLEQIAQGVLANPVIETWIVTRLDDAAQTDQAQHGQAQHGQAEAQ